MRTLVDLPKPMVDDLDALAGETGQSRAALVRRAVADLLARRDRHRVTDGFGLWRDAAGPDRDGLALQRRLRGEW
jgi:predicted transcriptional regulator